MQQAGKPIKIKATRAEVTNMRPASRMRPPKEFPAARDQERIQRGAIVPFFPLFDSAF